MRACLLLFALVPFAADAQTFLRTRVPESEVSCLHWGETREYKYNVHNAGSARTPGVAEFTAIAASFQTWGNLARSCSDYRFAEGPRTDVAEVGWLKDSPNNVNVLLFRE